MKRQQKFEKKNQDISSHLPGNHILLMEEGKQRNAPQGTRWMKICISILWWIQDKPLPPEDKKKNSKENPQYLRPQSIQAGVEPLETQAKQNGTGNLSRKTPLIRREPYTCLSARVDSSKRKTVEFMDEQPFSPCHIL
ncbi:hypothetical protein AVEN_168878-1 [Araneus ventricosus]|uniref:Uncharacterized protein n=1 Tax=Araneus ventricosus TaxID=182803 RepID=A0A4Y2M0A2_ARAVE|nr:hypothetical protein AVEN_168878-1 [Araneus ventricosus]